MTVLKFRPGWMIIDCSSARGGIRYDREKLDVREVNAGNGLQIGHRTTQTVDNVEFCAAIDACVKRVDYVLRKHCARTAMGWFADAAALEAVNAEIEEIKREANMLNARAEIEKSQRRAKVRITPLRLDFAQDEVAREIVHTLLDVLSELHAALRGGDHAALHKLRIRAIHADRLLIGEASNIVRTALARVPTAANETRAAHRKAEAQRKQPKKAGLKLPSFKQCAEEVDLTALEDAIVLMSKDYVIE